MLALSMNDNTIESVKVIHWVRHELTKYEARDWNES